jgi:hypothetical protein
VPELVATDGLQGIVMAISNPPQKLLDQIAALAEEHQLKIYRWRVGLDPLESLKAQTCRE